MSAYNAGDRGSIVFIGYLLSDCHFSRLWAYARMLSRFSLVKLFVTLWTVAGQPPLSMGFSRQEYWSGLPFSPPGDLPDPAIEPTSFMSPAFAGMFFTSSTTWEAHR